MQQLWTDLTSRMTTATLIRLVSSIVLAFILWGFVTASEDPEREREYSNVTIEVAGLPDDLQVVGSLPNATVTLTAPESVIDEIQSDEVGAELNVEHIDGPGTYSVPVLVIEPDDIWESSVVPSRLSVVIEQTIVKQFPIEYEQSGQSDDSKQINSVTPEVSEVTVRGPSSIVDRVARVVLPIDITEETGTYEADFSPVAQDADGQAIPEVEISPETVRASVEVTARGKSVAVITQLQGEPAQGYEVVDRTINPSTVLVDGPQGSLDDLVAVSTEPIDVSGATSTVSKRVRIVGLPEGVDVIEPADGTVVAVVQIRQRGVTQPLPGQHIEFVNVGPGLTVEANPAEVSVTVVASQEQLADLTAETISVQIDVGGLGTGVYTLEPEVILPPNMQYNSTDPVTVTVTIRLSPSTPTPSVATPETSPDSLF
jgi:YbbR domain-containing protein